MKHLWDPNLCNNRHTTSEIQKEAKTLSPRSLNSLLNHLLPAITNCNVDYGFCYRPTDGATHHLPLSKRLVQNHGSKRDNRHGFTPGPSVQRCQGPFSRQTLYLIGVRPKIVAVGAELPIDRPIDDACAITSKRTTSGVANRSSNFYYAYLQFDPSLCFGSH